MLISRGRERMLTLMTANGNGAGIDIQEPRKMAQRRLAEPLGDNRRQAAFGDLCGNVAESGLPMRRIYGQT